MRCTEKARQLYGGASWNEALKTHRPAQLLKTTVKRLISNQPDSGLRRKMWR
jgi:hypothetical protein